MDYYQLLDVPPDATPEQLKQAYRILVQLHHPDRLQQVNPAVRAYAEERLKRINAAYSVLADPEKRARYDAQHRAHRRARAEAEPEDEERIVRRRPAPSERAQHEAAYRAWMRQQQELQEEARAAERARQRAVEVERQHRADAEQARRAAAESYPRLLAHGEQLSVLLTPDLALPLVRIPAGEFRMGSDPAQDAQAGRDDQPQHRVYVSQFWLGRTPVTRAHFQAFAGAAHHRSSGGEALPEANLTWDDAYAFCQWLSRATGRAFRLPTEAEWEKAARGEDGRLYPWGSAWDPARANLGGVPLPVGQFSPAGDSPYGLQDMSGNVWEWCADWHAPRLYAQRAAQVARDPQGPASGQGYVVRGGAYDSSPRQARCAARNWFYPHTAQPNLGFRICLGE